MMNSEKEDKDENAAVVEMNELKSTKLDGKDLEKNETTQKADKDLEDKRKDHGDEEDVADDDDEEKDENDDDDDGDDDGDDDDDDDDDEEEEEEEGVDEETEEDENEYEDDDDDDEDDEDGDNKNEGEGEGDKEIEKSEQMSEKNSDANQCPICLNVLNLGQEIGTPLTCLNTHHFCLDCLEEWSKNVNTCPVDRKEFNMIIVTKSVNGPVIDEIPVSNQSSVFEDSQLENLEDLTYCEICGRCDREDRLLLCDNCDFGYHCECLNPPLETIPIEEWYCPDCHKALFGSDTDENGGPNYLQEINRYNRRVGRRVIARTQASELVRNRVERRRVRNVDSVLNLSSRAKTGSGSKKRKVTKKKKRRRTTKKRKSKSGTKTTKRKTKTVKRRRKKRKGLKKSSCRSLRSRAASRPLSAPTVRSRITNKLGLEKDAKLGVYALPTLRKNFSENLCTRRAAAGIGQLSIFGSELNYHGSVPVREELMNDISEYHHGPSNGVLTAISSPLNLMSLSRTKLKSGLILNSSLTTSPQTSTNCDVLGDILANQKILLTNSRDMIICKDGTLKLKENQPKHRQSAGEAPGAESSSPSSSNISNDKSSGKSESPRNSFKASSSPCNRNNSSHSFQPSRHEANDFLLSHSLSSFSNAKRKNKTDSQNEDDLDDAFISTHTKDQSAKDKTESVGDVDIYSDIESVPENEDNSINNNVHFSVNKSLDESLDEEDNLVIDDRDDFDEQNVSQDTEGISSEMKEDTNGEEKLIDQGETTQDTQNEKLAKEKEEGSEVALTNVSKTVPEDVCSPNRIDKVNQSNQEDAKCFSTSFKSVLEETIEPSSNSDIVQSVNSDIVDVKKCEQESDNNVNWKEMHKSGDNEVVNDSKRDDHKQALIHVNSERESNQNLEKGEGTDEVETLKTDNVTNEAIKGEEIKEGKLESGETSRKRSNEVEDGEIADSEVKSELALFKVKRCKHGKVIYSKKDKESKKKKDVIKIKQSSESEQVASSQAVEETSEATKQDNLNNKSTKIGEVWKKLSSSSKMRSYRDGKVKDEELLFREREIPKHEDRKRKCEKHGDDKSSKPVEKSRYHRRHRSRSSEDRSKGSAVEDRYREDKSDRYCKRSKEHEFTESKYYDRYSSKYRSSSPIQDSYENGHESKHDKNKRKYDDPVRIESEISRSKKRKHKYHKHKHRKYSESEMYNEDDNQSADYLKSSYQNDKSKSKSSRHHRHHKKTKYRHHVREDKSCSGQRSPDSSSSTSHLNRSSSRSTSSPTSPQRPRSPPAPPRSPISSSVRSSSRSPKKSYFKSSENVTSPQRSKKSKVEDHGLFSENVSLFKSKGSDLKKESETKSNESNCDLENSSKRMRSPEAKFSSNKPGSPPKPNVRLMSNSITEFDIFWDDNSPKQTKNAEPYSSVSEPLSETKTVKEKKIITVQKEETTLRFLPRALLSDSNFDNNSPKNCTVQKAGPKTPPENEAGNKNSPLSSPDQSMPTPTQDESLENTYGSESPYIRSNIKALTDPTPDIYDPEAPLESPENEHALLPPSSNARSHVSDGDGKLDTSRPSPDTITNLSEPKFKSPNTSKALLTLHESLTSQSSSLTLPPPPVSVSASLSSVVAPQSTLIAQIQQTLNLQHKASPQQQQQLQQLIQTASSAISTLSKTNQSLISNSGQSFANNHTLINKSQNNDVIDMDIDSPRSPQTPTDSFSTSSTFANSKVTNTTSMTTSAPNLGSLTSLSPSLKTILDQLIKAAQQQQLQKPKTAHKSSTNSTFRKPAPVLKRDFPTSASAKLSQASAKSRGHSHEHHIHHHSLKTAKKGNMIAATSGMGPGAGTGSKVGESVVLEDVPSSAVELQVKEKYIKKLNRQERVVEEVKLVLKPFYQKREINKEEYKEIMRKAVPKVCHSRTGEINPQKIRHLIDGYIQRFKHLRKKNKKMK